MPQPRQQRSKRLNDDDKDLRDNQIAQLREIVDRAEAVLNELRALQPKAAYRSRPPQRRVRPSIH